MGKASARKSHGVGLRMGQQAPRNPSNDPEIAQHVLDTISIYRAAAERSEALAQVIDHTGISEAFAELGDYLRHVEKSFHELGEQAKEGLKLPASMLGVRGKGSDGSSVAVGLDGIVQHSAPLDVLRALGVEPKIARAKRVRRSTKVARNQGTVSAGKNARVPAPSRGPVPPLPTQLKTPSEAPAGGGAEGAQSRAVSTPETPSPARPEKPLTICPLMQKLH